MTYPQQPQQPYAPQGYAPQQPPMPQYPAPPVPQYPQQPQGYPAAPPQAYAQPAYPAYPPQGYAQPYPAPPVAPPLPQGSLDDFYSQPSGGGGPSWKFNNKPIGTQYVGVVSRPVTQSDIRAATDQQGRAQTFKDGRQKWIMVVPMQMQPTQEFPDGVAGWWVKGQARDELARAMSEAGAPEGPPEAGAMIRVTFTGRRPIPGMNDAFNYRVEYARPGNPLPQQQMQAPAQQLQAPAHDPYAYQQQFPGQNPYPQQVMAQPQYAPQAPQMAPQQYAPQQPVQPPVPQQVPQQAQAPQPQAPTAMAPAQGTEGMSAEQLQLLARLTNGQPQG